MAMGPVEKTVRILVRLLLLAFLFAFMPALIYRAACGEVEPASLDDAYGKKKVFGAPTNKAAPKAAASKRPAKGPGKASLPPGAQPKD